jgi:hypothetical protein
MSEAVQYLTNQKGEQVGVFLDLETYHRLTQVSTSDDQELLTDLSLEELQALANSQLASTEQVELEQLSAEASETLDQLLKQVDNLNILKTRARYTLKQLDRESNCSLKL